MGRKLLTETIISQPQKNKIEQAIQQDSPIGRHKDTSQNSPSAAIQKPSLPELFNKLLLQEEYREAIDLYSTIYNLSTEESRSLRTLLVTHLYKLAQKPYANHDRIIVASDAYLSDFHNDIEVLLIKAQLYSATDNAYEALNTIQLANSYAITQTAKRDVREIYRQFITLSHEKHIKAQDWDSLIYTYQLAENTGLITDQDKLKLLEIHFSLGDVNEAKDIAEQLKGVVWAEKIAGLFKKHNVSKKSDERESIDSPKENEQYSSAISIIKRNNQFIVPLTLSSTDTQLLLDTGASLTTISEDYYQSISRTVNLRYKDKQQFLTANGKTTGNIYNIDKITIGDYTIYDVDIAVLDFHTSSHSNGLLGMNILGKFQFTIDQENAKLKLTLKE